MSTDVYVGVDSGGSRTNVQVLATAASGESLTTSYEVGESLSGALAPPLIPEVLRRIFAPLETRIERLGLEGERKISAWISAAGFSHWTRQSYADAIQQLMDSGLLGLVSSVGAGNDAVSILFGSGADGIVIAGTGSSVILRTRDGELFQAGGNEWVATDHGSGFWIGLRAIRQAYRDFEAGNDSVLLMRLREIYGLRPDDDSGLVAKLRDLAVGDATMKRQIAHFTVAVCGAAERGDESAQNLVKAEAEELADVTAGNLRRHFSVDELVAGLEIVECGSLLGNDFYRSSFESQIDMRLSLGSEKRGTIGWRRMTTGGEAAVALAQGDPSTMLSLPLVFRPVVLAG